MHISLQPLEIMKISILPFLPQFINYSSSEASKLNFIIRKQYKYAKIMLPLHKTIESSKVKCIQEGKVFT